MVGGESISPAAIVPVMDLLGGQVVRGVAGNRHEYRPLVSALAKDATIAAVAQGLAKIAARTIYVADLDAIQRSTPAEFPSHLEEAYRTLAAAPLHVWLDAGIGSAEELIKLQQIAEDCGLSCDFIVGLETLRTKDSLAELLTRLGPQRLIFSLDMKAGLPLTSIEGWKSQSPWQIAKMAIAVGVTRMILLDLADVGMSGGTRTLSLCQQLHAEHTSLNIIAGGGVRSSADLVTLAEHGCHAALVASALHDGRLIPPLAFL